MSTEENAIEKKKSVFSRLWNKVFSPKAPMPSRKALPFNRYDWIAMIGISVFYAFFAFANLGDKNVPSTSVFIPQNTTIEMAVSEDSYISYIYWCLLSDISGLPFKLEVNKEGESDWTLVDEYETKNEFGCWNRLTLPNKVKQVRMTYETSNISIREIVLVDVQKNILSPIDTSEYPELFDEQYLFPDQISHMSSYYFDESYYALTAYDFIVGLPTYETSHPPFGKIMIALGILLMGYNPLGIRIAGTLLGVLMLPVLYLLARNISRDRGISAFVTFLFAFDFMHFTQTRIATIDVFVTFFVIIMFYFMERYLNLSFYDSTLLKTWIPLGCCGIAFGFGIASKWTGFYAGAGLAILFFGRLIMYFKEYRYAILTPDEVTNGISHKYIISICKRNIIKTIVFCMFFYLIIPFGIYVLSYIPFVDANNHGLIAKMIENQKFMLKYHSDIYFDHQYASRWYEWPLMIRPINYFSNEWGFVTRQSINAFGNPMVWWAGIPAFLFTIYRAIRNRKKEAIFLSIAYLAQYVPWIFITRPTFIYHYFPSVPFVTLMIGYCFLQIKDKVIEKKVLDEKSYYCLLIIYAAVAFALFQLFLPVISGEAITLSYVDNYLWWLKEWEFVKH